MNQSPSHETGDGPGGRSPFEQQLTDRLHALAEHAPVEPSRSTVSTAVPRARGHGPERSPARRLVAVAAVSAVLLIAAALVWRLASDESSDLVATGGDPAPVDDKILVPEGFGAWTPMADGPITERQFAAAAWTGSEAVFWAGSNLARNFAHTDGASYDPATDSWSVLATPGWGHPGLTGAYYDGELFVTAKGGGSRYDPATGTWSEMAQIEGLILAATVATDDGIYGLGPRSFDGDGALDVGIARYRPETDSWDDPVWYSGHGLDPTVFSYGFLIEEPVIWSGTKVVLWQSTGQGLAYDPATDEWGTLPLLEHPTAQVIHSEAAMTDAGPVALAALDGDGATTSLARLEPSGWSWTESRLPIPLTDSTTVVGAGDWVHLFSPETPPVTFHVPSGQWSSHNDGPIVEQPNTVWTGDRLVVWGGVSATSANKGNMVWSPPSLVESESDGGDNVDSADSVIDEPTTKACDIEAVAESLRRGRPIVEYETSRSPADLFARSRAVVRGQLLWATPETMDRIEGTNLEIKHRETVASGTDDLGPINTLWSPATEVPLELQPGTGQVIGVNVVAFVDDQFGPTGAWPVMIEGLWIACDDSSPAVSVLVEFVRESWSEGLADGVTLNGLWSAATDQE